jgi:Spy/CpxP family protein refolding chaperone
MHIWTTRRTIVMLFSAIQLAFSGMLIAQNVDLETVPAAQAQQMLKHLYRKARNMFHSTRTSPAQRQDLWILV